MTERRRYFVSTKGSYGRFRYGLIELSRRSNSRTWRIQWNIKTLDCEYYLSDQFLVPTLEEFQALWNSLSPRNRPSSNTKRSARWELWGSSRYGFGKNLSLEDAEVVASKITAYWELKIKLWQNQLKAPCAP